MSEPGTDHESLHFQGVGLAAQNRWAGALDAFERAAALHPESSPYWTAAGIAAWNAGQPGRARECLETALRLDRENGDAHYHLGLVLESAGEWTMAGCSYVDAAAIRNDAAAYHRLGLMLARTRQFVLAAQAHREAVERDPAHVEAWIALGVHLCSMRDFEGAFAAWKRALDLAPDSWSAAAHCLLAMHYPEGIPPAAIADAHREAGARIEARTPCLPAPRPCLHSRIRIGYLSPDFGNHAVSYFAEPLLRHHCRESFEVIGYFDPRVPGAAARLEPLADRWHDISRLSDSECAELARFHDLDVLVDLAGYASPRGRLAVFAARPARLHVTAIGYPNTTGLSRIDRRLTDSVCDPPGETGGLHSERLLRVDPCFLCYAPPADGPDLPARRPRRPFTFGCCNSLPKLSRAVVETWAEILALAPHARLALRNLEFADPDLQESVRLDFSSLGVDPARILCRPPVSSRREHLELHAGIDLALDPFPYNGGTITCDALWMGVPVLTLAGDSLVSRMGSSILRCCGLDGWIASSRREYVALAVAAASEPASAGRRRRLREQVRSSSLLDGRRYTRAFEEQIRTALLIETAAP